MSAVSGATITASPQPRLKRRLPSGRERMRRKLSSSNASTVSIAAKSPACAFSEPSAIARSSENTASSAVNAVPSEKVTPSARSKVHTSPSALVSQEVASSGETEPSASILVSPSKTLA